MDLTLAMKDHDDGVQCSETTLFLHRAQERTRRMGTSLNDGSECCSFVHAAQTSQCHLLVSIFVIMRSVAQATFSAGAMTARDSG